MKQILERILYILARLILLRYKPKIIGITGSVGKTSAKEAIYSVLSKKFFVRKNIKNYNNEIGLPLTIIGCETGGKNPLKWLLIFCKAIIMFFYWHYPKVLILEMGADRPGDIRYLTKLAPCNIGVLTAIGKQPTHLEFYKNLDQLIKEKSIIINHLTKNDWAVFNLDEKALQPHIEKIKSNIMTFGQDAKAIIQASDINYTLNLEEAMANDNAGTNFKIHYEGSVIPFRLNNVLGETAVYAALAAIACARILKINLIEISESLKKYQPPKGRMNLIKGVKDTIIIDDSYNSSPLACEKALEILSRVQVSGRKIVCLANMEELGDNSAAAHRHIGRLLKDYSINVLFTVGKKAEVIAQIAKEEGMESDNIFSFTDSDEAKKQVQEEIHRGDVILIKGSQCTRMEKITKEIMAEPLRSKELLVRQENSWGN